MKKLLIFLFLASCVTSNLNISSSNTKLDFNSDLSFEEFNEMLIEYDKINPHPNINK